MLTEFFLVWMLSFSSIVRSVEAQVKNDFTFPSDQPVAKLDASTAFNNLTEMEKLYAHYMSRAAFYGGLIVLSQASQESPQIFRLIHRINLAQSPQELRDAFKDDQLITNEDLNAYFIYCSGVYTNMGNYKSFGDMKFIPDMTEEKFEAIVMKSKAWRDDPKGMGEIWDSVKTKLFSLSEGEQQLGLGDKGVTKYFSSNCDQIDADKVTSFLKANNIEAWNSRVIKTENDAGKMVYEIRLAAIEKSHETEIEFDGALFVITTGDYSPLLSLVNGELENAKLHALNEIEQSMIEYYIDSFRSGSLDAHKNGSRYWIKDKSPDVESYIGFIEVYRDPVGQRAEFEAFVAMVNAEQSIRFQQLVENAEKLLPELPWPQEFEKDEFLRPDFTSLDVLTFAGSGIPKGINIPNYDEIRQTEGFKNVNLGNVVSSSEKERGKRKVNFVTDEDDKLLSEWKTKSFDVQVGLHELLGHGSGKLFMVDENGNPNYDTNRTINPLTGGKVDPSTVYQYGETYGSVFGGMSSAYEECRAESVGLFLCSNSDVLKIFGFEANASDIVYVNWLSLCLSGIAGLESYSPSTSEWNQAHSRARFTITQVLFEAGQDFVNITETVGEDGQPDLLFQMDRNKLETVGFPAMREYLLKLQVYKSTADIASAQKMFDNYSAVNNQNPERPWLRWRDIILARKKPRKMFIQANTFIEDGAVKLTDYDVSHDGMIESWRQRFNVAEFNALEPVLKQLYLDDLPHFSENDAA